MTKATCSFRTGYAHAMAGEPRRGVSAEAMLGTFARTDYDEGYKAALNDKYWALSPEDRANTPRPR